MSLSNLVRENLPKSRSVDGVAFCNLSKADVVRHHLVQRIVEAYEEFEQ